MSKAVLHSDVISIMQYPRLYGWIAAKTKIEFSLRRNLCKLAIAKANICNEATRVTMFDMISIEWITYFWLKMTKLDYNLVRNRNFIL